MKLELHRLFLDVRDGVEPHLWSQQVMVVDVRGHD
jgi:hypothetical protein